MMVYSPEPSNRTSQQTRFNKKKTGAEEGFVLDFAYNPEAIENLYKALGIAAWVPSPNRETLKGKVLLEVPIFSGPKFIFGYADIVISHEVRLDGYFRPLLIEVKSERCSVLDLIKQLNSYAQFNDGLPVFIHLYDLEPRENRALLANGIYPVDGRLLL